MLEKALWSVSVVMARIGGVLLVATALLVTVEVILRKTGIATFSLGTELSSYALAIGATWSFALVLLARGHVRIDIVSQRLPDMPRAVLNVLAVVSLAGVGLFLAWGAFQTFLTSLSLGAVSNTTLAAPLFIPQGLWAFGLAWFTLVALYQTGVLVLALLDGDIGTVERLAAPGTAAVEAEEVATEARTRMSERTAEP